MWGVQQELRVKYNTLSTHFNVSQLEVLKSIIMRNAINNIVTLFLFGCPKRLGKAALKRAREWGEGEGDII